MNLTMRPVENPGDPERERIVLRATKDVDIGDFAMFMAPTADDSVLSGPLNAYWFPDQKIKLGDFVVLYTKSGTRSEKKSDSGNTSYFLYWGLSSPRWASPKLKPVLLQVASWIVAQSRQQRPPTSQAL